MGAPAFAADVYLEAQPFELQLPWGESVPMWGFANCEPGWVACKAPAAPGPQLDVATGDPLTIHLHNTLPTPVSVLIPGQAGGGDPVFVTDGRGRQRARSMTHETAAGGTADYSWDPLRPGTYLYHSGTEPSIQVPMGLFGALVVGPATGVGCAAGEPAYDDPKSCYDSDAVLVFSEVDPWMNAAIDAAGGDSTAYPSTVDYQPTYFLVNGEPSAPMPAGAVGDTVLLRMLNAGLASHVPSIVGLELGLIAEDGFPYPGATRFQSSALVPAGKTVDALVTLPDADVTVALYDRMPPSSSANQPNGGVAYLEVGAGSQPPGPPTVYAVDDVFGVSEEQSLLGTTVLANDVGLAGATVSLVRGPVNGIVTLLPDGTFSYSPNVDFSGVDTFVYAANDGTDSFPAHVTIEVSPSNDAPVASDDGPYVNTIGPDIAEPAPGVLGNDADSDGDALTAVLDTPPASGTLTLASDGSFTYVGGTPGASVTFTYHAEDAFSASGPVTVTLATNPVANIALTVVDDAGATLTDFRWMVQEDASFQVDPSHPPNAVDEMLATSFHKSYMPVVVQGAGADTFAELALDPVKHYYVSVLPGDAAADAGHAMSGAQIPPGTHDLTVTTTRQPTPTARVSVVVFEDNQPTNGVVDPVEPRLGGFQITLEDAGGRYGISGGTMSQDAFGNPLRNALDCFGSATPPVGVILTCPDGSALIDNLPPGKYGVTVVPAASDDVWIQTSTIEGTRVIDTWVQADEPPFMVEFGAPGYHAFIGFVNPAHTVVPADVPPEDRTNAITGAITLFHDGRPPSLPGLFQTGSYEGLAYTRAWVGLNSVSGDGPSYATIHAETDGTFRIPAIPDGSYQLVIWDDYLDQIIAFQTVTVAGADVDLGQIPVNAWFTRQEHNVFLDENQDGVRQETEQGLAEQVVNLRFRDGSVFQSFPTDTEGFVPMDEVFPFFNWQVAEVDFTRFKPTGLTVTVDAGGDVSGGPYPGLLTPQEGTPRTETGPVLLEAFQGFPGQTTLFDWGKAPYAPGENGGISGIVFYASTRGENDPRLTVGDPWEAGLPAVKVRLYREVETDFAGTTSLALVQEVLTDSWDAAQPTGCPGEDPTSPYVTRLLGADELTRCYDGWRNWNQARPGVFDGGYAFVDIDPGTYVVEVVPPSGFELVKEEDKNVDFGDVFGTAPVAIALPGGALVAILPDQAMVEAATAPEPGLAQPPCVGDLHLVPDELVLFDGVETYAPFAGTERPLCDRKRVVLADQGQAAADFHLFTSTPIAAQFTGLITDDIAAETNPASPGFGEKFSPAFMPFSIRDYTGHELYRGYSDGFGRYNGLVPSTFAANIPIPSGYSPAMYAACLNDPGTGAPDPLRNPNYGTACYTLQFMPRTTSYLDTPVLPESAFAAGFDPVDCGVVDGTPVVTRVDGAGVGPLVDVGGTLTILADPVTTFPNPAFEGPLAGPGYGLPTVDRDTGFGSVTGTVTVDGAALTVVSWTSDTIVATVPAGATTGELVVTRGDNGAVSTNTVTVTVGAETPIRVSPGRGAIQAAIDAAAPGALILVEPGTYHESVIVWKPVRLQGAGSGVTIIDAIKQPTTKLDAWQAKIEALLAAGAIDLVDGQPAAFDLVGGGLFANELGAAITVVAKDNGSFGANPSRIDGFTVTGAEAGGGIFVNAFADGLEISNNLVTRNSGTLHGGVRIGNPFLAIGDGPFGLNIDVNVHHNAITLNGATGQQGTGGGVSVCAGSDDYRVTDNFVCGNYTSGDGAGIAHLGLSDRGTIAGNTIVFNQSFDATATRSGGGIFVGGEPAAPPALSAGSGSVTIDRNTIQGNQAGAGHGGGIRAEFVNGRDVELSPDDPTGWYLLSITNNLIVNNVAGWSGGGISLQDAPNSKIVLNTVANNDSTATVGAVFDAVAGTSTAQPAGLASSAHSPELDAVIPATLPQMKGFSNPTLTHDIFWHNRSFSYAVTATGGHLVPELNPAKVGGCPAGAVYRDLGVTSPGFALAPLYSILSAPAGSNNSTLNPKFVDDYCNGARTLSTTDPIEVTGAAGEGGNFLDVRYGPLSSVWPAVPGAEPFDYHVTDSSPALDWTPGGVVPARLYVVRVLRETPPSFTGIPYDVDDQDRTDLPDLGADEVGGDVIVHGECSANSTSAGLACLVKTDCPPNTGPIALRGQCVF
ncbi:MAG: Ig-like domain-containing protein [Myxococcota bacterium]